MNVIFIILVDPRTRGFTYGQLLNGKYRAFCSLKDNFGNSVLFETLSAFVVNEIAEKTTLLRQKFEASSQDYVLSDNLIAKHVAIISKILSM